MQDLQKNLMYKVCLSYYNDNLTQQDIGKKYGISRIMVSRLLKKAIQEKMVEIKIHSPSDTNISLERMLEAKYMLKEVVVVSCHSATDEGVISEIGEMAAHWFVNTLEGSETIALSWGKSMLGFINALPTVNYPNLKVVQMIGGLGEPGADVHGTDLTRRFAQVFNAKPSMLSSPGIVKSKTICDALKDDHQINETLKLAASADLAIMGIGGFNPSSQIYSTDIILSGEDKETLMQNNAVGDLSLHFFNQDGKLINGSLNDRIVGLEIEQIQKIPRTIGIAGGSGKHASVLAALRGKFLNVLITDEKTAQFLLKN